MKTNQIQNQGNWEMQQQGPDRSDDKPQITPHSANWPMVLTMLNHPSPPLSKQQETSPILVLWFMDLNVESFRTL